MDRPQGLSTYSRHIEDRHSVIGQLYPGQGPVDDAAQPDGRTDFLFRLVRPQNEKFRHQQLQLADDRLPLAVGVGPDNGRRLCHIIRVVPACCGQGVPEHLYDRFACHLLCPVSVHCGVLVLWTTLFFTMKV